jgi:hypothetical protein
LSAQQVQAVLAHELAHIRRFDYAVNLIQTAIETIFFHHPAVWWISAQIRRERENCCDDIAASMCGSSAIYAGALVALEERRGSSLALAATDGSLLGRIRRLLGAPARGRWQAKSALVGFVAVLCVLGPIGWQTVSRATAGDTPATPLPAEVSGHIFYRVTIGADGFIAINGGVGNWQTLKDQLGKMPAAQRAKVVIAVAAENDELTVGPYLEAQARAEQLVKDLGLAYMSIAGVDRHGKSESGMVYVRGDVQRSGVYQIPGGAHRVTVRQQIISAGGGNSQGAPAWITLTRRSDGAESVLMKDVPLEAVMNGQSPDLYLQPDDVLMISIRAGPSGSLPATQPSASIQQDGWSRAGQYEISADGGEVILRKSGPGTNAQLRADRLVVVTAPPSTRPADDR